MSIFHNLIYRALNIPLTEDNRKKELDYIFNLAEKLGFQTIQIQRILRNQIRKQNKLKITTLMSTTDTQQIKKYMKIIYVPQLQHKLGNLFKKFKIVPAYYTNTKMKSLLGNCYTQIENCKKSGIYEIKCSNCDLKYIGQTRRNMLVRYKEHMYHVKCFNIDKSAVAGHAIATGHKFPQQNVTLLKASNIENLNMFEAIYMKKYKPFLMNYDLSPLNNILLDLITTDNVPNSCV